MNSIKRLGIDTGGTFTDFVLLDQNKLTIHKVLSTPSAPEKAILQGISEMKVELHNCAITHGSTVATNAVLEKKGVKTAYITNLGFKDTLTIGRQARQNIYQLCPQPIAPPVAADLCFEIDVRMDVTGAQLKTLDESNLFKLASQVLAASPQAIAINLLYSYLDDSDEQKIKSYLIQFYRSQKIEDLPFISCSSEVLAEYREYERGMATWLNAWTGPKVKGYINRLKQAVSPASLTIMQSSGGTIAADYAAENAVRLLLSGPAGGLAGAQFIAKLAGYHQLLSFDMGGTSTDVALIDGQLKLNNEGKIGNYPVAIPMVDMHTIGAGGGSIATIDKGGVLQVGPDSAGAFPGPACYQQGATQATVTDANLLLGRLPADSLLGGTMPLSLAAATQTILQLSEKINLSVYETAMGIIKIANQHMSQALRVMSVQKGINPQDLALVPFGGAGGLHVCALADSLNMQQIFVPIHGGVLSALGMVVAPTSRDYSQTIQILISNQQENPLSLEKQQSIVDKLKELINTGHSDLLNEGILSTQINSICSLDLRYKGQSHSLNINIQSYYLNDLFINTAIEDFHKQHLLRYGFKHQYAIELVNLRVRVFANSEDISLPILEKYSEKIDTEKKYLPIYAMGDKIPVYSRETLLAGFTLTGPALISEQVSTTFIEPNWHCQVDKYGNLCLHKQPSSK
ncbi:MAG: hydantoinase/oxoprolinase family protein [Pseudomonadota bacterium]